MTTDPTAAPPTGSTAVTPGHPATGGPDPADSSTGELLRTLTENLRSLVQGEVASARAEMTEKALAVRPAAAMLGGAAVLGMLAAGTSATVLVRALDRFLPPTSSAVVATALLGAVPPPWRGPGLRSCAAWGRPFRSAPSRT